MKFNAQIEVTLFQGAAAISSLYTQIDKVGWRGRSGVFDTGNIRDYRSRSCPLTVGPLSCHGAYPNLDQSGILIAFVIFSAQKGL